MFFEMGAILQKKPVLQEENASRPNVFWIESTRNIFSPQKKIFKKSIDILKNFPRCARPFDKNLF